MEVEKRASKGGLLHMFDWGVKSRKKLFSDSSSSELPVGREETKDNNNEKLPNSRLRHINANENKASSSNKRSEYNCASSVTSDESNGARALGVVARLMGLNSFPTSNGCEPCSTSFIDSSSFRDTNYSGMYTNLRRDHIPYGIVHSKVEKFKNPGKSETEILQSRKIERFQTEVLPRKSVKPIPVTHNKLLSPIKNPDFIPMKDKDYTMEVAATMIEPSPESKRTSFVSSSVPIRIRDLKEKMEAANKVSRTQRPKETDHVKQTNGQWHHKNSSTQKRSGKSNTSTVKVCINEERCSGSLKNKGNSSSLAARKKVNGQSSASQTNGHKRTLNGRASTVLRQNNNKQNNIPNKDKSALKTSFSNQQLRKSLSANASSIPDKAVNKVVLNSESRSRKIEFAPIAMEKELSPRTKTLSQKKKSVDDSVYSAARVDNDILIHKNGRSIQCNTVVDGNINWGTDKRKDGNDVVSFTFSSPIKRSMFGSRPSGESMEKSGKCGADSRHQNDFTYGLNIIGTDALSILLEQKLRELTYKIESPGCNLVEMSPSSAYNLQTSIPNHIISSTASVETETESQVSGPKVTSDYLYDSDDTSVHDLVSTVKQQKEHESDLQKGEPGEEVNILHPVQLTCPGLHFSYDNCYSPERRNNDGRKRSKEVNSIFEKEPRSAEDETDSVSSTFTVDMASRQNPLASLTYFIRSSKWELQYITDILETAEFTVDNLALGQAYQISIPNLFDQIERVGSWEERNGEEYSKLARKVLFDCVRECLDIKCRHLYIGNHETRDKWFTLFRRKEWLVYELYKDISGLKNMEDLMVDELVNKDMSTELGKWLDFKIEAFEEGVEVQERILDYLVDELVTDIML